MTNSLSPGVVGTAPPPPPLFIGRDEAIRDLKERLGIEAADEGHVDGEQLKRLREQKKFTQQQLAEKADLSKRTIEDIERGRRTSHYRPTVEALAEALGVEVKDLRREETVQILTAMRGWPGVGKTTVATALANDADVSSAYPDGVLWAFLGTKPEVFSELDSWARACGVTDLLQEKTLEHASRRMAAVLRNRRLLLIIDDVWEPHHAKPLMVGGRGCATLVTTRSRSVAEALATPDDVFWLDRLSAEASLDLLKRLCPQVVEDHPDDCRTLVRELEGLPLALQVAGRLLHSEATRGWNVQDLLVELHSGTALLEKEAPPDMADIVKETPVTVVALLKKSTDVLDARTQECFALLGVVKEKPATFDLNFLRAQWRIDDPKPIANALVDRGLLEPARDQRFQMHALLVAFAYSMLEK